MHLKQLKFPILSPNPSHFKNTVYSSQPNKNIKNLSYFGEILFNSSSPINKLVLKIQGTNSNKNNNLFEFQTESWIQ